MTVQSEEAPGSTGTNRTLRVGILCQGGALAAWQLECVRKIQQLPFVEVSVLVVNAQSQPERKRLLTRLRANLASGLILWRIYERLVLSRKAQATRVRPFPPEFDGVTRLAVSPVKVGKFRERFDEKSLEALRNFDLDVLLRFGFGILTGEILDLPRYGVWSYHHGDPEFFRGAPPGFWEIEKRSPVTGVVLQRLTEKLDGGVLLHAGWFRTNAASYPKSLDRILLGASHFVARALVDVRRNADEVLARTPVANCGPVYRYPRTMAVLSFLARSTSAWLRDQYRSLFRHQQWTVGVVPRRLDEVFRSVSGSVRRISEVGWLPEKKGRFLADPFAVSSTSNDIFILAEDFDWSTGLGQIAAVKWPWAHAASWTPIIQSDRHLSYPYTFENEGTSFCVPENAETRQVALYRLIPQDRCWQRDRILIDNFAALDPTIVRYDRLWWLFCTDADAGPNEFLCAWYATSLNDEWTPHSGNPLRVDVRGARPAGKPFMYEGALIRPAQDCSTGYGRGITFNRIIKLTPDEFHEETIASLMPEAGRYCAGLHTVCAADGFTIVDGARTTFVPAEFRRALRRKFGRNR